MACLTAPTTASCLGRPMWPRIQRKVIWELIEWREWRVRWIRWMWGFLQEGFNRKWSEKRASVRCKNLPWGGIWARWERQSEYIATDSAVNTEPCYEYGEILGTRQLKKHKPICVSIFSRLRDIGYGLGCHLIGSWCVECKRCYLTEEFSWGRNRWRIVWGSSGEKTDEWVGGGGELWKVRWESVQSEGGCVWGNEKVVGNM